MIALYDTLAGDLRRAADAERSNNLEKRCLEVNHALLVIGYLEDAIEQASGGELAKQLVSLYLSLRRKLIEAQAKRSPEILEEQMDRVLRLRESWQKMERSVPDAPNSLAGAMANREHHGTPAYQPSGSTSWSA
jgi:flagellar protein FliS